MLSTMTDLELVQEIKQGNNAAFRAIYYRHVDNVFGLVTRILGPSRADREDVVQEVFLSTHKSISRFRGDSSFSTWLHRVTINTAYSHLRRSIKKTEVPSDKAISTACTFDVGESRIDARRSVQRMYEILDRLSPKNRIVFVLYEFQGLTLNGISETLDIPLHTAASRLRRSRESLMQGFRTRASSYKRRKK